ncbi:MAG: hypothetical protein KF760_02150 [Candidatus Eremiobacteraeota bacterium]|nr:hypothetical protein [Candidatus Eremiobacteraeota bacterium]MCW5870662.1 hypothetical protein [Candidatus Eremiobacteraeota bacterium]
MWQQFFQGFLGDFTNLDLTAINNQWNTQQNAQMNGQLQGMMQQNMADPRIQQAYRQYQSQGGPMSFEQFVYGWMATGGYTPEGMRQYRETENANQQREWAGHQNLRAAEMQRAQAQAENRAHFCHNQSIAGQNLMGQATYATPMGAQVYSYTMPPGYHQTPQGTVFVNDRNEYFLVGADGWHYPIQQQSNLPFR